MNRSHHDIREEASRLLSSQEPEDREQGLALHQTLQHAEARLLAAGALEPLRVGTEPQVYRDYFRAIAAECERLLEERTIAADLLETAELDPEQEAAAAAYEAFLLEEERRTCPEVLAMNEGYDDPMTVAYGAAEFISASINEHIRSCSHPWCKEQSE